MNPSFIFHPTHGIFTLSFLLMLLICVFSLGLLGWIYFRKKAPGGARLKPVIQLVLAFVFLAAFCGAFFTGIYSARLIPVQIGAGQIKVPGGTIALKQIEEAYLYEDRNMSPINPESVSDSTRYLIIREINGKEHTLAGYDYPVDSILICLNKNFK